MEVAPPFGCLQINATYDGYRFSTSRKDSMYRHPQTSGGIFGSIC